MVVAVSLLFLAFFAASTSAVEERQQQYPQICYDFGNPSTPVGMCFQSFTNIATGSAESVCTGDCRVQLELLAAQCPGGAAIKASIETVCADFPTPEIPTDTTETTTDGATAVGGISYTLYSHSLS